MLATRRDGAITPALSTEILDEERRVADFLSSDHPDVTLGPILAVLAVYAGFAQAPPLPEPVAADPDDDRFLACAVAVRVGTIVSGDRHLPGVSGWNGVRDEGDGSRDGTGEAGGDVEAGVFGRGG